jgi:streptogramin lyase
LGLAVDGRRTVWFAEANSSRLGRYRAGEPITEIPLTANANPRTLRSAPDGSVWFAEPGIRALGHVTPDGKISEKPVNAGEFSPNWGIAVGTDGSVWYGAQSSLARLMRDGSTRSYPVQVNSTITVDSQDNAWIPMASIAVVRVSPGGQVSQFAFDNSIDVMAEAADGGLWFVDTSGGMPRVGRIDEAGQTQLFNALNAQPYGFPNSIVRAPDGAVWFTTRDHRFVRLASATDVAVYTVPWADITFGPFAVLSGNRIVMVGHRELYDFQPTKELQVASAQAIPSPTPYVPKDAAEGAAYAVARDSAGPTALIDLGASSEGDAAAAFEYQIHGPGDGGYVFFVYLVQHLSSWQVYDKFGTQNFAAPFPGRGGTLQFRSGCVNVRQSPSLSSQVVTCLGSGASIQIDGSPTYADGYLWWHLDGRGWAAHKFLYCLEGQFTTFPQC